MIIRARLGLAVYLGSAAVCGLAAVPAAARVAEVKLAAQPLDQALRSVARQTSTNILFAPEVVRGLRAPALKGEFTGPGAVERLLRRSGLGFELNPDDTILIRRVSDAGLARRMPGTVPPLHFAKGASVQVASVQPTPSVPGGAPVDGPVNSSAATQTPETVAGLDEIVITARKQTETLQDTPAAVTVASGDRLLQSGVQNLNELATIAPSIKIVPIRNQTMIYLRGVGQALTQPNADPSIAVNVNGAYVPSDMTGNAFFDVDRVEVLPGPQGTLYGRNAAGGVVNVITRLPSNRFGGEGYLEVGNYERIQAFAALDVPLSDSLGVRTAFITTNHDGYYDNGADDQETSAARLTIAWRPGEATKLVGIAMYAHDGGIGMSQQTKPTPRPRHLAYDPRDAGIFIDFDTYLTSLQLDHELSDNLLFTYVAGYDHLKAKANTVIFQGPPLAIVKNRNKTEGTTQEARLSGRVGSLEFLGGLYYYWSKAIYDAPFDTGRLFFRTDFVAGSRGEAAFGSVTWHGSDRLRLTGGLRFSHDEKKIDGVNTLRIGPFTGITPYDGKTSDSRLDWKIETEYDLTKDSMLYANVATGYNTGGLSNASVGGTSTDAATFKPVELLAFTAGSKNRFFDGVVTLNLEGYYYDYKNYQVSARNPTTFQNQLFNAKKSEIYGLQLDTRIRPSRSDDLNLSVNYLHAEAVKLVTPTADFSGFELPYSPKWTVNASYQHVFDLAARGTVEAFTALTYVGDRWGQYTHLPGTFLKDYVQVDGSVTYRPRSRRWSLAAWSRNLTDEDVYGTLLAGGPPGPASGNLNPPRTYGLRFGANF